MILSTFSSTEGRNNDQRTQKAEQAGRAGGGGRGVIEEKH